MFRQSFLFRSVCFFLFVPFFLAAASPKNVILFIGDGMGPEQVKAARQFKGEPLVFEKFPSVGESVTHNIHNKTTDSAASATAMATGVKVENGVVSRQIPGDSNDLLTILEEFSRMGRSTGLITTTDLTDATPACFGAHARDRGDRKDIAKCYFEKTRPNLLLGGDKKYIFPKAAKKGGYTVVRNREGLQKAEGQYFTVDSHLYGGFGSYVWFNLDSLDAGSLPLEIEQSNQDVPHLNEMTKAALGLLGQNEEGFFLMVEGANIDKVCHYIPEIERHEDLPKGLEVMIGEVLGFESAVNEAVKWARGREDTLIVVTADHETGGLKILQDSPKGHLPKHKWTSKVVKHKKRGIKVKLHKHTGENVPVYALGLNSTLFVGLMENTEFKEKILADLDLL